MKIKNSKKYFGAFLICLFACLMVCLCSGFSVKLPEKQGRYSASYGDDAMAYAATVTERIDFTKRDITFVETNKGVPLYSQIGTYANSCGAVAGAIVVGFYDAYYENLIPNYNPLLASGKYKRNDATYVPKLFGDLYTLMRTNVDDVGVSEEDCKSGLRAYVNNHGQNLSYSNVKGYNAINEAAFVNAINNNQPVLLFCDKMDLYSFSNNSDYDLLIKYEFSGAHIAVGFGLYTLTYYNGNNNFRTDKYLRIATGISGMPDSYLKLESTDWCDSAYAVSVY